MNKDLSEDEIKIIQEYKINIAVYRLSGNEETWYKYANTLSTADCMFLLKYYRDKKNDEK